MTWTPGVSKQMHWTCMYFLVLSKALGISCNPSYCRFTFPKPARKTGGDAGRAGRTSSPSCSSSDCGEPRNGPLARCQQGRNHEGNEGNNQGFEWFCAETTVCLRISTQNCSKTITCWVKPTILGFVELLDVCTQKNIGITEKCSTTHLQNQKTFHCISFHDISHPHHTNLYETQSVNPCESRRDILREPKL